VAEIREQLEPTGKETSVAKEAIRIEMEDCLEASGYE
jgi:hypothetical protein